MKEKSYSGDRIKSYLGSLQSTLWWSRGRKVFCIGANKTGTTSLGELFRRLGLRVGQQGPAEMMIHDWARRNFLPIVRFSRSAEAFQDVPFSLPFTYQALDAAFPEAKFILTIRDSAQQWYKSLTRFHTRIIGKGRLPTAADLKEHPYRYKGYIWDVQRLRYGIDEKTLYDPDLYQQTYLDHNKWVQQYFRHKPEKLLVVNVADYSAAREIVTFLGLETPEIEMPHLNKSATN
jgi:hypothetical protein